MAASVLVSLQVHYGRRLATRALNGAFALAGISLSYQTGNPGRHRLALDGLLLPCMRL